MWDMVIQLAGQWAASVGGFILQAITQFAIA